VIPVTGHDVGPSLAVVLALAVLLTPAPPADRARRAPLALPEQRRRGLVAGFGLLAAGVLAVPGWWYVTLPASIAVAALAGRARPRPSPAELAGTAGDLAVRLDLIAACLRSGMDVAGSLVAAHEVLPPSVTPGRPSDPAAVLSRVAGLLGLGAEPATAWRVAEGCPDLAPVAAAACRSAVGGTALADALSEQAATLRARVVIVGSKSAGRAAVLIAAPLGVCFLPSFLCLGLAPVVIGLLGELRLP
jgi:hypothetical protein